MRAEEGETPRANKAGSRGICTDLSDSLERAGKHQLLQRMSGEERSNTVEGHGFQGLGPILTGDPGHDVFHNRVGGKLHD